MMTKKNISLFGLVGTVALTALTLLSVSDFCYNSQFCVLLFEKLHLWSFANYIFFTPPLLLLSLITYKMHDEVFTSWANFAKYWVPLTILLSVLAGFGEQPSYMPALITTGTVSFLMSSLFLAISLILIAYKFFTLKKGEVGK
jgi:hypothetical protein